MSHLLDALTAPLNGRIMRLLCPRRKRILLPRPKSIWLY